MSICKKFIRDKLNWTKDDLNKIYNNTFEYSSTHKMDIGPSNSFAIIIAALCDFWGSILSNEFNKQRQTKSNVRKILLLLYKKFPNQYNEIYKNGTISNEMITMFRDNLVHVFGKKPGTLDLNIDTNGKAISWQPSNKRWHVNCKELYQNFLIVIEEELEQKNLI